VTYVSLLKDYIVRASTYQSMSRLLTMRCSVEMDSIGIRQVETL